MQLSVGAEIKVYGGQAAAASNQFHCKSMDKPSRKPCAHQNRVVQMARSYRGHLISSKYFASFMCDSSVNMNHEEGMELTHSLPNFTF